mmetsp:Transcript_8240/g.16524  ORF Transcript_8240/g.16524 Transcript_8240/m.16524 type:complete len:400 (+) Transcript_8240:70-1269(+)
MFQSTSRHSVNQVSVKHTKASFWSFHRCNLVRKPKLLMPISRAVEDIEATATDVGPRLHLHVTVPLSVNFGEHLRLVGSCPELGEWDVNSAPQFRWTAGDLWQLDVDFAPGLEPTEFKLVHVLWTGECIWEYTNNRTLDFSGMDAMKDGRVMLKWCDESEDAMTIYPEHMSTIASWDEDDTPLATGFDDEDTATSFTEDMMSTEEVAGGDNEPIEMIGTLEEPNQTDELVEDSDVMVEDADIMVEEEKDETIKNDDTKPVTSETVQDNESNQKAFKKVATTAGMVAAGVAGAALLGGLAVDMADTAVLGAFAVAAGSAAFGPKSAKKNQKTDTVLDETDTLPTPSEGDEEEKDRTITEPGTIIAAGLLSAFEQGTKVVNATSPEQRASDLPKDDDSDLQ